MMSSEIEELSAAAVNSMFPAFWQALIEACRATRLAPARLLGPIGTFRFSRPAREAVGRLRAVDCPFDLETSRWGSLSMLAGFRRLAAEAGIEGAEKLEFDVLYA